MADTAQALVQEWATAWSALEPGPYLDLYSDSVQFYYRGARSPRPTFEKQVRSLMAGHRTYRIEPINPQIDVLAEDAAVASFRYKGRAVDTTGNARDVSAAVTLVYQRRGGRLEDHSGPRVGPAARGVAVRRGPKARGPECRVGFERHVDAACPSGGRPRFRRIHFAGEHTSVLRATMEGALRSGIRAATEVNDGG